jgi:hypothetical protein
LRWSDRREDFRTEILGLVKAQMVKNAVIVPMGAKGGFVAKRLPDPQRDREGWAAEGEACYRAFIGCLLELTDNLVTGSDGVRQVVPPPNTRRYDGDDISSLRPTKVRRRSPTSPMKSRATSASGSATRSPPVGLVGMTTKQWESPHGARGNR